MAQSPIPRSELPDRARPGTAPTTPDENKLSQTGTLSLGEWAKTLSVHGAGSLSPDLLLDIALNELVEFARVATGATAAAIALKRDDEFICRATTGEAAPDLGVRLNTRFGLSAACVQTGQWQRTEDTADDPRVDAEACRRLGARSILVVPLLDDQKLLGVIEVFSTLPKAFTDREVQTLQDLSQDVVNNIRQADEIHGPTAPEPAGPDAGFEVSQSAVPVVISAAEVGRKRVRGADPWSVALLFSIVVLSLILGWMVGRVRWQTVATNSSTAVSQSAHGQAVVPSRPANSQPPPEKSGETSPANDSARSEDMSDGGLAVYQNGKLVFQAPSQPRASRPASEPGVPQPAAASRPATTLPPLHLSPDIAREYVTTRVEPEYPNQAIERHIQGPVVLDAIVGPSGAVQKLTTLSGHPKLAEAATNAVRQWRFRPFFHNGRPEEFETRITVIFKLP